MRTRNHPALFTLSALLAGTLVLPGCGGGEEVPREGVVVVDAAVPPAPPPGGTHYVPPDGDELPPLPPPPLPPPLPPPDPVPTPAEQVLNLTYVEAMALRPDPGGDPAAARVYLVDRDGWLWMAPADMPNAVGSPGIVAARVGRVAQEQVQPIVPDADLNIPAHRVRAMTYVPAEDALYYAADYVLEDTPWEGAGVELWRLRLDVQVEDFLWFMSDLEDPSGYARQITGLAWDADADRLAVVDVVAQQFWFADFTGQDLGLGHLQLEVDDLQDLTFDPDLHRFLTVHANFKTLVAIDLNAADPADVVTSLAQFADGGARVRALAYRSPAECLGIDQAAGVVLRLDPTTGVALSP